MYSPRMPPPSPSADGESHADSVMSCCGDNAAFMEVCLSEAVRSGIEAVLHNRPRDPIRFLADSLVEQQERRTPLDSPTRCHGPPRDLANESELSSSEANDGQPQQQEHQREEQRQHAPAPPLSFSLEDGSNCKVRSLASVFARSSRSAASSAAALAPPPPTFPSVLYREAASLYEVGACLRQLQQLSPQSSLVVFVETPAPSSTVFFYEGTPYSCATQSGAALTAQSAQEVTTERVRNALREYGGNVQEFMSAVEGAAQEAAPAARLHFVPFVRTNYLELFDEMTRALEEARKGNQSPQLHAHRATGSVPNAPLPCAVLLSYRVEAGRHTYARLLAAYGPLYEEAQRVALQSLRRSQLDRKRKFGFAYAMVYWAQVQRRRESTSNSGVGGGGGGAGSGAAAVPKVANGSAAADGSSPTDELSDASAPADGVAAPRLADGSPVAAGEDSAKTLAKEKRVAARSVKRGLPTYDAEQQAEDDVFLVVIRRLEHAAATLIQSAFRGYRARLAAQERRVAGGAVHTTQYSLEKPRAVGDWGSFTAESVPPLLRACLHRLREEGEAFGAIWAAYATSPPPESRRCWVYRPVQRAATTAGTAAAGGANSTALREHWVQEELLIPPQRATEPRVHIDLLERLLDYLAVAQCTVLDDAVQLLTDSPGLSVLQRRGYDGVKSICLTLFYVAYSELRQRSPTRVPPSFSQYMQERHNDVLRWCSFPHECSMLLKGVDDAALGRQEAEEGAYARAVVDVVQRKLLAQEFISVAAPDTVEETGQEAASVAVMGRLSTHVCLCPQPLLPPAQWVAAVEAAATANDGAAHTPSPTENATGQSNGIDSSEQQQHPQGPSCVHWWSAATTPLCLVGDVPVAAVARCDGQAVEGVPAYDCFVPRVRRVGADDVIEETGGVAAWTTAQGDTVARRSVDTATAGNREGVLAQWFSGELASAADAAFAAHTRRVVLSEGKLECHCSRSTGAEEAAHAAFTSLPPSAALTRFVAVKEAPAEGMGSDGNNESAAEVEEPTPSPPLSTTQRRSVERGEPWERVMEAVAAEVAASRRSTPQASSVASTPRPSLSAPGWSRNASVQQSPTTTQTADGDRHGERAFAATRPEDGGKPVTLTSGPHTVRTVEEAASAVGACTDEAVQLQHTRQALRFLPGTAGARLMDLFVDRVAACVVQATTAPTRLVLALDVEEQAFFALAAVLIDHRMKGNRDGAPSSASSVPERETAAPANGSSDEEANVEADECLAFLCGLHETLATAVQKASLSHSSAEGTPSAGRLAVQHVSRVMREAAANSTVDPAAAQQLNLLQRIKQAIQRADDPAASAAEVQACTVAATQLTEQYAWLLLLEWYLWSPQFPFVCTNGFAPTRRQSCSLPSAEGKGFAEVLRSLPAVLMWVEQMDPWASARERCPDALHLRYSNGLRRWDDKHYVCFGAL